MGRFDRFVLAIAILAAIGLASEPVQAKNIGTDFPKPKPCRGYSTCACPVCNQAPSKRPWSNCVSSQACIAGKCYSLTEGTDPETYHVVSVKSSTGAMLDLSLTYNSYNADASRARFNTVLARPYRMLGFDGRPIASFVAVSLSFP